MKATMLSTLVLGFVFVFSTAFGRQGERPKPGPFHQGIVNDLNLTDSQKKDVEKLNTDFAKQRVDQQAKIKTAQIDLHSLMKADAPSKEAIEKKIGEIADLQAQNRVLGVEHWFAVNKLLTPDQQKIWKNVLERTPRQRLAMRLGQMRERMMRYFRGRPAPAEQNIP